MTYWTEAQEKALRDLWAQGMSASLICLEIGATSRNAVIGKVTRLGLPARPTVTRRKGEPRRRRTKQRIVVEGEVLSIDDLRSLSTLLRPGDEDETDVGNLPDDVAHMIATDGRL